MGALSTLLACSAGQGGGGALPNGHLAFINAAGQLAWAQTSETGLTLFTASSGTVLDPAITRDGKTIVFGYDPNMAASKNTALYSVTAALGATPTLLAAPLQSQGFSSPVWDEEGANVYFVATSGGSSEIEKVPASGGAPSKVSASAENVQWIALVNDTTLLVTATGGASMGFLTIATGQLTPVTGAMTTSRPAVSNDGTAMAYVKTGTGLTLRNIQSSVEVQLDPSGGTQDSRPWFSPDDSYVLFDAGGTLFVAPTSGSVAKIKLFPGMDASWGT
jgi:Tol biopolymer transport system component